MIIITIGKNMFAVHGVDQNGKTVLVKPKVSRAALPDLIAGYLPVLSGWRQAQGLITGQGCFGSMAMNRD